MATASSSSPSSSGVPERRGIPAAAFVEDVQTYLSQLGLDVNSALAFLQERSLLSPFIPLSLRLSLALYFLTRICLHMCMIESNCINYNLYRLLRN